MIAQLGLEIRDDQVGVDLPFVDEGRSVHDPEIFDGDFEVHRCGFGRWRSGKVRFPVRIDDDVERRTGQRELKEVDLLL